MSTDNNNEVVRGDWIKQMAYAINHQEKLVEAIDRLYDERYKNQVPNDSFSKRAATVMHQYVSDQEAARLMSVAKQHAIEVLKDLRTRPEPPYIRKP